jgi:hypothetical protein
MTTGLKPKKLVINPEVKIGDQIRWIKVTGEGVDTRTINELSNKEFIVIDNTSFQRLRLKKCDSKDIYLKYILDTKVGDQYIKV